MTNAQEHLQETHNRDKEDVFKGKSRPTTIDRLLQKLSGMELPAKEHLKDYLRHKWRLNHKPPTVPANHAAGNTQGAQNGEPVKR